MKTWQKIALWTLGLSGWFVLLGSSSLKQSETAYQHFSLSFENRQDKSFLSYAEMEKIVQKAIGDSAKQLVEINKALLEESIDNHPAIRKAEVYSKIDGSLRIMLWQHNPVARVIDKKGSFYLLENGARMPLSKHYSEEVPLVSGVWNEESLEAIASFWKRLEEDDFFKDFFAGMACENLEEWVLYPTKGNFKIVLGDPEQLQEKLTKLMVFYKGAPRLKNINKLKEIDLRYEGQVICRKN